MFKEKLRDCPRCGRLLEAGFSGRNSSLSRITVEKMKNFAFVSEDLNRAGLKTIFPWIGSYSPSYHCAHCEIFIVDYGTRLSSKQAKEMASSD